MRKQNLLAAMVVGIVLSCAVAASADEKWQYGRLEVSVKTQEQQKIGTFVWTSAKSRIIANDVDDDIQTFYKGVVEKDWTRNDAKDTSAKLAVLLDDLGANGWEMVGFQVQGGNGVYIFKRRLDK